MQHYEIFLKKTSAGVEKLSFYRVNKNIFTWKIKKTTQNILWNKNYSYLCTAFERKRYC